MHPCKRILSLGALLACAHPALAQSVISYGSAGASYTQNFDGLPTTGSAAPSSASPVAIQGLLGSSGVTGWYFLNDRGSSAPVNEFRAQDGSLSGSAGRGVVSFGTTASTDRALGTLATSNQVSTFGLYLQNDTPYTLTQFTLGYTGEQWRIGDIGQSNVLTFGYKVVGTPAAAALGANVAGFSSVAALNFTSPFTGNAGSNNAALNGNSATYQQVLGASQALSWAPGQVLVLQWYGQDLSGQDNGLAIDNLSFAAIPEPATSVAVLGAATLAFAALRRRRARSTTCAA